MKHLLSVKNKIYAAEVKKYIIGAFLADKGKGDITSKILIPPHLKAEADIIIKQPGILAGTEELIYFLRCCKKYVPSLSLTLKYHDGDKISQKTIIGTLNGKASEILLIERTALNLLQRMSGIATLTKKFTNKMEPGIKLAATRKTHWGLLDKKACTIGGALPHRFGLYDAVLIKDNHLTLLKKDFSKILKSLLFSKTKTSFCEIEIADLLELKNFLTSYGKIQKNLRNRLKMRILLDNMTTSQLQKSVKIIKKLSLKKSLILEASGGVNFYNIRKISRTGIDIISVGALTHSAPALDISLKITKSS